MNFVFQLMFFDTQISIRNRLGYVCIEYAAYCIEYARIEHAKCMVREGFLVDATGGEERRGEGGW